MESQCWHIRFSGLSKSVSLKFSHDGDICRKRERWYGDTVRATNKARWVREVLEAIEAVLGISQASLWHLLELDPHNGGKGKRSDRGECLSRLNAKTLAKLRDWLEANKEEAVKRSGSNRYVGLRTAVGLSALLTALPPDEAGADIPYGAATYRHSGRVKDLILPIKVERLRRQPRFRSERDLAQELGVPRSTLRDILKRMEEVNFSLEKITLEELEYIAWGETRGPKHQS